MLALKVVIGLKAKGMTIHHLAMGIGGGVQRGLEDYTSGQE